MSMARASALLDRAVLAHRQQRVLRAGVLASTVAFLWLVVLAGGSLHVVVSAGLLVLAVLAALMPDSSAPLFLVLGLAGRWWVAVPDAWSGWTLAAAVLLLAVHLASTLGAYGPPALAVPGDLLRTWVGRAAVMLAVTALVWLVAGLFTTLALPGSVPVLAVALGVVVAWIALLGRRLVTRDGD